MALWSGRFTDGPTAAMQQFSSSLDTDLQMWREDLEGSIAHARMLGETGIVSADEADVLIEGLNRVGEELGSGVFVPTAADEDIHLAIERRLTELVGPVGQKLHTARSRNDQVATDVRLWLVRGLRELDGALTELVRALLERVRTDGDEVVPGYTHLQRGQPIFFGHHLLAHAWMVHRDLGRLRDAIARMDECPLGAGALAGGRIEDKLFDSRVGFSREQLPHAHLKQIAAREAAQRFPAGIGGNHFAVRILREDCVGKAIQKTGIRGFPMPGTFFPGICLKRDLMHQDPSYFIHQQGGAGSPAGKPAVKRG